METFKPTKVECRNSPQYKNANIADFVLAVPFKINKVNEVSNIEM